MTRSQFAAALPLLRRTVEDVRTARSMLLLLPPELLQRLPVILRYIREITETHRGVYQRSSDDDGDLHDVAAGAFAPAAVASAASSGGTRGRDSRQPGGDRGLGSKEAANARHRFGASTVAVPATSPSVPE